MNDPFRTETNHQVLREARIGLLILAVTLGVFSYVAYKRISGSGLDLPKHVLNAPVAESVWPGAPPANATNPMDASAAPPPESRK